MNEQEGLANGVEKQSVLQILDVAAREPDAVLDASLPTRPSPAPMPGDDDPEFAKPPPRRLMPWEVDFVIKAEMHGRAVQATMDTLAAQGLLGPVLTEKDLEEVGGLDQFGERPLADLQALRNIVNIVRSEAIRSTPARYPPNT